MSFPAWQQMILEKTREMIDRRLSSETYRPRWATVTQSSPLRIHYDGETTPLTITPDNLTGPLPVGTKVQVGWYKGQPTVIGVAKNGDTDWKNLATAPGFSIHEGAQPQYRIAGGQLFTRGAIARNSGAFGTSYEQVSAIIPELAGLPSIDWNTASILASQGNRLPLRGYIHTNGHIMIATTAPAAVHTAPTYVTLTGFSGLRIN